MLKPVILTEVNSFYLRVYLVYTLRYNLVMNLPYIYKLIDLETGKWYIGSKTAKNCCFTDLGVKYFTSSKYVEPLFKANPKRFSIKILLEDKDADYIVKVEHELLTYYDARNSPESYNCSNGDAKFNAKKCALLLWENEEHRNKMSEIHKSLYKTEWRKEQLQIASLKCKTPESLLKLSDTHKTLAKTQHRKQQLHKAWKAAHTPEASEKRSKSMKLLGINGKLKKFQELGSKSHLEKLKSDPVYAENYSNKLKAGWIKRKTNKESDN